MHQPVFNKKVGINRDRWKHERRALEKQKMKFKFKLNEQKHLSLVDICVESFGLLLKLSGQYNKGIKNAKNIHVKKLELSFHKLPKAFENYTILHLSDLHIDTISGFEDIIIEKLAALSYDICFWTGDYRKYTSGAYKQVLKPLEKILNSTICNDGLYGVLGNHDTYEMVDDLEQMGIQMLINESLKIAKQEDEILITGTDDPHYYPSKDHITALQTEKNLFKVALIHSPEMFAEASANFYDLYLCGHTHAGQICLPNGYAPIKNLKKGHRFMKGLWQYKSMTGYTSSGCGVSGLPVRYNTRGEITLITLKKKQ